MKVAVTALLVAGLAQATQQDMLAAQDMSTIMGSQYGEFLQVMGLQGLPPGLIKKAKCAAPCLLKSAKKVPCQGKDLLSTACDNVDKIKKTSQPCLQKCGVSESIIGFVADKAKQLCKSSSNGGGKYPGGKSPEGKSPEGKSPEGKSPEGKSPGGGNPEMPPGKSPNGKYPGGKSPEGGNPEMPPGKSPGGGKGPYGRR